MFDHFTTLRMKVTLNEIINETKSLDESKASLSNDIPTNVIKENYDIFATFITENFNNMIENSVFPVSLKQADIKPIHKKIPGVIRKITGL